MAHSDADERVGVQVKLKPCAVPERFRDDDSRRGAISSIHLHLPLPLPCLTTTTASFCAPRRPMRAIYEDRIWQTQFQCCCTQNMELFTATSPFANHQPTTVPVWAQNSSVQTRLRMTFTSENYWGVNLLTYLLNVVVVVVECRYICVCRSHQMRQRCTVRTTVTTIVIIYIMTVISSSTWWRSSLSCVGLSSRDINRSLCSHSSRRTTPWSAARSSSLNGFVNSTLYSVSK